MLRFDPPLRLVMPPPISVNNLFANVPGRGRVTTKDYSSWKRSAAELLALQGPFRQFTAPVNITYFAGESGIGMMDAGNIDKALTDALVTAKIIRDDNRKWVRSLQVFWTEEMRGVVAVLEPAGWSPLGVDVAQTVPHGLRGYLR
ncbi:MAG: RusA family crossover junction endodeoxyribonuclease [Pseudooceanicola atlanticus]